MTRQQIQSAFEKYNSDKSTHSYAGFYSEQLIDNPHSLLEIGVKEGASLRAWKELMPDTVLFGLDLFQEFKQPEIPDVTFFKGNQLDADILYHIRHEIKPQIIVEDCSHNCIAHWVTLYSLIPCCEWYFIEDLQSCKEDFYRQGLTFDETVLGSMLNKTFPFFYILSADQKIAVIKSYSRMGKIKLP